MRLADIATTPTSWLRDYIAGHELKEEAREPILLTILDRIQALEEHARAQDPNFKPAAERG